MGLIKSFFYDFRNVFTIDDKLIVWLAMSLFLPYPITAATIVGIAIYVLTKSDFKSTMMHIKFGLLFAIWPVYLLITSLANKNWIGAGVSVAVFASVVVILYFRKYINKELFDMILDVMIIMSIISVIYACFEQVYYMCTVSGMNGYFDIQNKPQYRVKAFYMNSNYYDMMIMFVELFCVYRFISVEIIKKRILYTLAGVANMYAMFLTGGRTCWLALAVAVLVMLVANKWYKTFTAIIIVIGGAIAALAMKPKLLPRLASQGLAIGRRTEIWRTAILMIKDHPIFGQGPMAYFAKWREYLPKYKAVYGTKMLKKYKTLGISAPHSHTMFLEPIVSFGIVGTVIITIYILNGIVRMIRLFTRNIDRQLGSIILAVLVMTVCFSIVDFAVFWVQTGILLMMVLGASDCYDKEVS